MRLLLKHLLIVSCLSVALTTDLLELTLAQDRQKKVLVLYATRRDAQIVVVGDRELPRILEQGLPEGLDYYSEFIDQARFPQAGYEDAFSDFLRSKYKGQQFDLVVAMGDTPLEFVEKNRAALFPGTPVVFFTSSAVTGRIPNATGLAAELNLSGTLDLAIALQPDTRHVFVVSGADQTDVGYENAARAQLRPFESRLAITYFSGLATKELETRLAALPEHAIVYYLIVSRDGNNQNFHQLEYLDRITAVANAPVYCWVDSAMDHGIVGGSLKDQVAQTRAIATLALRVLRGEPADNIPTASHDLNVSQIDWRQLQRWGIRESRIPNGVVVKFREPTLWERDKAYILTAAAVLLAQTALIAALLVQRARRREAEERVRGREAELRASYERIRDLGGRLLKAQESERSRIARDLHDDISQQMALLEIDLTLLGGNVDRESEDLAEEALNRTRVIAKSVHELSHRLHPAKLQLIGLVSALHGVQRELSQPGFAIKFTHDNVPATLPPDLTLCFFRVVQEALQNASKYSQAHQVSVHLCGHREGLVLTIVDDGVGFDVDAAWGKGLGLISMSERVDAIGGSFEIRSQPGAGTQLEIKVPLVTAQNPDAAVV
jgi:signal transduction histidine kinase